MPRPLLLALLLSSQEAGETVVSSPRAPALSTETPADRVVVSAEELAATNERSLPRQLGKAAGVWIQETNLGGGSPILQGLSGNQVLLVVDGVRVNDATTRNGVNQMLNGIDPASVERIEVLRGPRSVLYGSDALGGAVLVWTKRRAPEENRRLEGALDGRYESATSGVVASLEASHASARQGWLGVGSWHDWDGLRSADGEVENTGYSGESLFGSWEASLGAARRLRATASVTRDHDVPRTDRLNAGFGQTQPASSEFELELQDRRRLVLAYADAPRAALADSFEARLSFRSYEEERDIRSFGGATRRVERDETSTLGLALDLSRELGDAHRLTYGFDVDHDDVDSSRTDVNVDTGASSPNDGAFAPGSQFLSSGVFVQDEISSGGPWHATLGARAGWFAFEFEDPDTGEDEDGDFSALSGSAALARDLGEGTRAVATLARGFRAPNLAELAREASFFAGTELPNADLEPESSLYAELALEHERDQAGGGVAAYYDRIEDVVGSLLVDAGGAEPGDEVYLRENVGTLEILGALARGWSRLGGASSSWLASATIEYAYGVQSSDLVDPATGERPFDGVAAQRIPPLHGWAQLRRELDLGWLDGVDATASWAAEQDRLSPQDAADPRIDPDGTEGWVTIDVDVGGELGLGTASRWFAGVHNVLDASYRVHGSGIDSPGVGLVVGFSLRR